MRPRSSPERPRERAPCVRRGSRDVVCGEPVRSRFILASSIVCFNALMLASLKEMFAELFAPDEAAARADEPMLQLATAVMLVEVMRAEPSIGAAQRLAVVASLRDTFALPQAQIESLIAAAEKASLEATDLFGFTSYINDHFDMPAKLRMVEHMWRVAYADGHLGDQERHVMWRLSDLLHVPQGAYINAKMRAKSMAGVQ
jgi:uncharacterized tellurite resistance protein B-like protein